MTIYKLSELCDIINGSKVVTNTGHVPVVGSGGVFGYTNTSKTTEHSIALPRKGTMIIQYYSNPVWNVDTTYLATNTKKDKVYIKYLYYKLLNSNWKSLISGSTRPAMTKTEWSNFEITIPYVNVQKEIIDIIAPLERLISLLNKQRSTILKIIDSLNIPKSDSLLEFEIVKTGKRNANHESNEGKYNFYTCGQEVKKCNEYSFDGKYILLSGNANLYSWWYNGKFDLYQRVYALRPKKDFFTTYYSVQLAMQKLRDESSGSVIKYIKLDDIYNIELYSNKYEYILKPLYICIAKIDDLLSHTTTILDNQIKLLIK